MRSNAALLARLCTLSLALIPQACSSPTVEARPLRLDLGQLEPSAHAGLVRVLEVVAAQEPRDATIRIRALESESVLDRQRRPFVRVFLDVTVLADDYDRAWAVFDQLEAALANEGRASSRPERVSAERGRRVFENMDWSASSVPDGPAFERLVSVSDSIRVEVRPGRSARLDTEPVPPVDSNAPSSSSMGAYIRSIASEATLSIGTLRTESRLASGVRGPNLRYGIAPANYGDSYPRGSIGRLLFLLEARSPGVSVTRVEIEPAQPRSDLVADRWSFDIELSVPVSGGE